MKTTLITILCVVVFFEITGASQRSAEDDIKEYIRLVLENLREEMPNGIPSLNIPPLDPFQLKEKTLNIKNDKADVVLDFVHLTISGLSTFKSDIGFDLGSMSVEVDLSFDHIKGNGLYKLDGKILKLFPIYGDGDIRVDLQKPQLRAMAHIYLDEESFTIDLSRFDITWVDLKLHLGNFLGHGNLSRILELMLPALGQKLISNFNPHILNGLNELINKAIAKLISEKPEIKEILKNIVGGM